MRLKTLIKSLSLRFFIGAVTTIVVLSALLFAGCSGGAIRLVARFFIVYCYNVSSVYASDNLPSAVQSAGGSGYELTYNGREYVCYAAYSLQGEAFAKAASLTRTGLECGVITLSRTEFEIESYYASRHAKLYERTLIQIKDAAEEGERAAELMSAGKDADARRTLSEVASVLRATLTTDNVATSFTAPLVRLANKCEWCASSIVVLTRDVYEFQLMAVDVLFNTPLT